MTPLTLTQSQQSAATLPGTWKVESGRAVTLRPREDGLLRIAHGCAWITFDGPHAGPANDLGDRVVGAGERLRVHAGRRVVLESSDAGQPVYFSWDFAVAPAPAAAARAELVLQPLPDLRLALVLGGGAALRLVAGLARLAAGRLAPRTASARSAAACG